MNERFSIFLDFIRFFAAMVVFLGHLSHERFTGDSFVFFTGFEHDAVMIFLCYPVL